jgi:hypothetical protein
MYSSTGDQRIVVVVGGDVEAVGVGEAEVGLDPALHLQRVLLPGGDQRADPPALAAEQAVQHRGAAEDGGLDPREALLRRRVPLPEGVLGGGHQPHRLVLRRGLRLADHEVAFVVDDEGIGHRSAGIDRQHARVVRLSSHRTTVGGRGTAVVVFHN